MPQSNNPSLNNLVKGLQFDEKEQIFFIVADNLSDEAKSIDHENPDKLNVPQESCQSALSSLSPNSAWPDSIPLSPNQSSGSKATPQTPHFFSPVPARARDSFVPPLPGVDFANGNPLASYPAPQPHKPRFNELTIGDLHGNALVLIWILLQYQIIELNQEHYKTLHDIYSTPSDKLTRDSLNTFIACVNTITASKPNVFIRLLGDELADRGSNDYFTLKVLEKLHQLKIPTEIMLSNHSVKFISCMESYYNTPKPISRNVARLDFNDVYPSAHLGFLFQSRSTLNLCKLIDRGLVKMEEIDSLYRNLYIPQVKALSYTLNSTDKILTLYSHAPTDPIEFKQCAKEFERCSNNVSMFDSPQSLRQSINYINFNLTVLLNNNQLNTQVSKQLTPAHIDREKIYDFITWNRNYEVLDRPPVIKIGGEDYQVHYVHGHDSSEKLEEQSPEWVTCLDSDFGKAELIGRAIPGEESSLCIESFGDDVAVYLTELFEESSAVYLASSLSEAVALDNDEQEVRSACMP